MSIRAAAPPAHGQSHIRDRLTPSQQPVFDQAIAAMNGASIVLLEGESGVGKSTLLRALHQHTGGKFLDAEDILRANGHAMPNEYEQIVYETIRAAIEDHEIVYYDNVGDFQFASHASVYHRPEIFDAVFKALYDTASLAGKKFVGTARNREGDVAAVQGEMIRYRPVTLIMDGLKQADYHHIFAENLGESAINAIDFDKVYAFSRRLTGYFIAMVCNLIRMRGITKPTTQDVITVLREQLLKSNVDVREVEKISFDNLLGVEEIVEKLDRTILLPLREPDLARELGLQAKHGVILHGPPGTGKTTIGRALAHMMQGKFFMIDGDFDHQSAGFFGRVQALFEAAQRNAPSVIFIDDADVILTDPRLAYFGRYLLTQLDGLMNEASGRICVMMTAMDIRGLPLALLRSGRMEVWLEMQLPDAEARSGIIANHVAKLPITPPPFDMTTLSQKTEGFTPADLRRVVNDATGHLALDRHLGEQTHSLEIYLDRAATALREQKVIANTAFNKRGGHQHY